jgi:glutamate--cysteine ligase
MAARGAALRLPAFWVGLLYDQAALDAAWDEVPRNGLATPFRGGTVQDLALRTLEIADSGLAARNVMDWDNRDERKYLHALWEIARSGISAATEKRQRFEAEWQGSVDPVFAAYAY